MPKEKYTEDDKIYINRYYSRTDNAVIAARMSKPTTPNQIRDYANRHGLTKSENYTKKLCVVRAKKMNKKIAEMDIHQNTPSELMDAFKSISHTDRSVLIPWQEGWTEGNARTCLSRVNVENRANRAHPFELKGHYRSDDGYIHVEVHLLPRIIDLRKK